MSQSLQRQILQRARDIIADHKRWTQLTLAQDKKTAMCDPCDKHAVSFCSLGAIQRAASEYGLKGDAHPLIIATEHKLAEAIEPHWLSEYRASDANKNLDIQDVKETFEDMAAQDVVIDFNDTNCHIDVVAAFDLALEKVT